MSLCTRAFFADFEVCAFSIGFPSLSLTSLVPSSCDSGQGGKLFKGKTRAG